MDDNAQATNFDYDYERLADDMDELDCIVSAAEYHGMVSGRLIGGNTSQGRDWREQSLEFLGLAPDQPDSPDLRRLWALPQQVAAELKREDFGFQLFLPPDNFDLELRAEELGCWCEGFLTGLALAGQDQQRWAALPAELVDGLSDLAAIAQLEAEDNDTDNDYTELFEYVRMVVLNAHAELSQGDSDSGSKEPVHGARGFFQGDHKIH